MISNYLEYATAAFVIMFLLAWIADAFFVKSMRIRIFALGCLASAGGAQLFLILYR